jgi:predicted cupin superfamily sugar epimerase
VAAVHPRAQELIRRHRLRPHPEGGHYREVYRDPVQVPHPIKGTPRSALTHILFLLEGGAFSAFHRVAQTELWQYLEGAPLALAVLTDGGACERVVLGPGEGQLVAKAVEALTWQAAIPLGDFTLCGCSVAPGFTFDDFELPSRSDLLARFPDRAALVLQFTR